jgi:hypothetical protein
MCATLPGMCIVPGADSHISGRSDETNAALQVGMPPTQNIGHVSLEKHYISVELKL